MNLLEAGAHGCIPIAAAAEFDDEQLAENDQGKQGSRSKRSQTKL